MTTKKKDKGEFVPVRWRTCDECDGKGKKPVFWAITDEDEEFLR
jgi:hypothetical protein